MVEKPQVDVNDADVDAMIETLRKQQASWSVKEGEVGAEDRATIDFTGSIDGEAFEGGKATDFVLAMGQGRMIPGFEDGILGHKAGEEFVIDVTFPEDYHAENLKGKAAKFDIVLKKVEERELPEMTAEFIKRFGVADGSLDGLKAEVRKNMTRELKNAVRNRIKARFWTAWFWLTKSTFRLRWLTVKSTCCAVRPHSASVVTSSRRWSCRASCSKSRRSVALSLVCCWAK